MPSCHAIVENNIMDGHNIFAVPTQRKKCGYIFLRIVQVAQVLLRHFTPKSKFVLDAVSKKRIMGAKCQNSAKASKVNHNVFSVWYVVHTTNVLYSGD